MIRLIRKSIDTLTVLFLSGLFTALTVFWYFDIFKILYLTSTSWVTTASLVFMVFCTFTVLLHLIFFFSLSLWYVFCHFTRR